MINRKELDTTIAELEAQPMTYSTCEKLSWLYTVRDHIKESAPKANGSEFVCACSEVDIRHLLKVLDEHMECIKATYPREYEAIINKLKEGR